MNVPPAVPYGAAPWHQAHWDWRAAGNFIGGGLGAGIIVFAAVAQAGGNAQAMLFVTGLACVGLGLGSVALELGRPLRAINVFRNPRRSWMSREAIVATLLIPVTAAAAAALPGAAPVAALLALLFVFCQARLLQAAKGIPAWRDRRIVALIVATGLAEGGGLYALATPVHHVMTVPLLALLGVLLLARIAAWQRYRSCLATLDPRAAGALRRAGAELVRLGTVVPLLLMAAALLLPEGYRAVALALAGACALAAGSFFKFVLVTRAAYNSGFVLPELPVRGVRP